MCIFCQIVEKKLPANIVDEDENFLAFHDINPQAPVHVLIIPRVHTQSFHTASDDILQGISSFAKKVATKIGIDESGYRIISNIGSDGGQEVEHLHYHLLGGAKLKFGHFVDANTKDNF